MGVPPKKKTLSMRVFGPRNSAYAVNLTYETYRQHIYIYHAKSRLNTPVWGSLRSPNNRKKFTSKWKKEDVRMAKRFSKKYGNKG